MPNDVSMDWPTRLRACANAQGFRLVERLGEGGFGETWLAENRKGEKVVFKFASPENPKALAALQREADLYQSLRESMPGPREQRPPIARILLSLLDADPPALVIEYMSGGDLRQFMKRRFHEPLRFERSLPIVRSVLEALAFAHRLKIVHRDLSPENILRGAEENEWKVSDFGLGTDRLASAVSFERSAGGFSQAAPAQDLVGKIHYMAPEQRRIGERVGPAADLYALGVIWVQLLTGKLDSGLPALWQDETPAEALPFIRRCLAADPAARPGAADLLKEVKELEERIEAQGPQSSASETKTSAIRAGQKKKKKRWSDNIPRKFRRNIYSGTYEQYEERNENIFRFYRGFMFCVWMTVLGFVWLKFGGWIALGVSVLFVFSFFGIGF
jgi:serine/threonine protein kinase